MNDAHASETEVAPEIIDLRDLQGAVRLLVVPVRRAARGIGDTEQTGNALLGTAAAGLKRLQDADVARPK